ncbi:hypothetical protein H0H93_003109 [Arthromyces matolae]|nr:hypothetical protein H0H93_003109 [Arthromyces matolae]
MRQKIVLDPVLEIGTGSLEKVINRYTGTWALHTIWAHPAKSRDFNGAPVIIPPSNPSNVVSLIRRNYTLTLSIVCSGPPIPITFPSAQPSALHFASRKFGSGLRNTQFHAPAFRQLLKLSTTLLMDVYSPHPAPLHM